MSTQKLFAAATLAALLAFSIAGPVSGEGPVAAPAGSIERPDDLARGSDAPQDFEVLVDLPTGFVYIHTLDGWRYMDRMGTAQLRHLPPTTRTSLLSPEQVAGRYATRVEELPGFDPVLSAAPSGLVLAAAPR